ncbi:MAG: TIGR04255 family protein [Pseudomonadales bacterium]|nr:TIGR04255 family protein [Pseudomonadales bacterium]
MLKTMASDPILEALFELRFTSSNPATSSIILGCLSSSHLGDRYTKTERLAAADIPLVVRRSDKAFSHQPEFRLRAEDNSSISIGSNSLSMNVTAPYIGGEKFLESIYEVLEKLISLKLGLVVERVAFRYINLVEPDTDYESDFDAIKFQGNLMGLDLKQQDTFLQVNLKEDDIYHVIKVSNQTEARNNQTMKAITGLLLDIDTYRTEKLTEFWSNYKNILAELRASEREVFETIMERKALERYK